MSNINVSAIRMAKKASNLVGWVDITADGTKVRNCRVVKSVKQPGTYFIGVPNKKGSDGRYYPEVRLSRNIYDEAVKIVSGMLVNQAPVAVQSSAQPTLPGTPAPNVVSNTPVDQTNIETLAVSVAKALHSGDNVILGQNTRQYSGGACRGVDISNYRFMTQNPNTNSQYATMAKNGQKVSWVFANGAYFARVIDGVYTKL